LLRILRNVWADRWRRRRLELPLGEEESNVIEPYYDWEGQFLRQELSEEVERALGELSAEHRWAVLLADVEELSYQEIAEVMGCPIGTVMSRVNRGRRSLARLLRVPAKDTPPTRRGIRTNSEEKE
jgi:RNA polymerase sigma-70 factor, ECF subfamily